MMGLQRILFLELKNHCGQKTRRKSFSESICAWACGPIVLDVHNEFKRFANNSIPTIHTVYDIEENFGLPISKPYEEVITDSEDAWFIDTIVDTFGLFPMTNLGDAIFLQEPWKNAYKSTSKIIDEEELKKCFDALSKSKNTD